MGFGEAAPPAPLDIYALDRHTVAELARVL
jgi:hypothetical protein